MTRRGITVITILLWAAGLAPLLRLVLKGLTDGLGANPIEFVTLSTGTWTLILLLATLSVTPLRALTRQPWLLGIRRAMGLLAFLYGSLHVVLYVWLDKFFDLREMAGDVLRRPFITAGLLAYIFMVPLAATSSPGAVRRMGARRWKSVHSFVYFSAIAGVVHFWWKAKADVREPAIYAAALAVLLAYRLIAPRKTE